MRGQFTPFSFHAALYVHEYMSRSIVCVRSETINEVCALLIDYFAESCFKTERVKLQLQVKAHTVIADVVPTIMTFQHIYRRKLFL